MEREVITLALEQTDGWVSRTAHLAGMSYHGCPTRSAPDTKTCKTNESHRNAIGEMTQFPVDVDINKLSLARSFHDLDRRYREAY